MKVPVARALPGVVFAVLVILLALGNSWIGIYPFGQAVWIRPILGCIGIAGAICLFCGNGWWRVLLPIWCLCQSFTIATDVSGEWFKQGISLGFSEVRSESVRNNQVLTSYSAWGMNSTGMILVMVLAVVATFRLHPGIRRRISIKRRVVLILAMLVVAIFSWLAVRHRREVSANYVLDLDLPNVPIYYKDQMLGRTPLRFTPQSVAAWGLPVNASKSFSLYSTGWADCVILSDGEVNLPLYAGVPWPFAGDLDQFESPWGTRCRMAINSEEGNRRNGYVLPTAELQHMPILEIYLLDPQPIPAGSPLRIRCDLSNPTSTSYTGRLATIERYCFSYDRRDYNNVVPAKKPLREIDMPPEWNTLSDGQSRSADLTFDAPDSPGDYELFCTWFLYEPGKGSSNGAGSVYSNMLMLRLKP